MVTFQELLRKLSHYWEQQGCIIHQGYDLEVGAGTMNPATTLRCLGPEPYRAAYIEPSRRPSDGRYGTNPNRLQRYYQYQVILKPSPLNMQELYLDSLKAIGLDLSKHDIRFVHDDWENPTIGAWGLGWEVWLDGMEVTQYTYFQCLGGLPVKPVTGELTYGIERLAMYLQGVDSIFNLKWDEHITYGDIYHENEVEFSRYNFEEASTEMWKRHFNDFEKEAGRLIDQKLPLPAYDFVLKSSHAFNMLDARGAISVTERTAYIGRIRDLAKRIAESYIAMREHLNYPLLSRFPKEKIAKATTPPLTQKLLHPAPGKKETFLLEIGSEELPATFVPIGMRGLQQALEKLLTEHEIPHGDIEVFGTPRRLSIIVKELSLAKEEKSELKKGPSVDKVFDEQGNVTPIGTGFFKSLGKEFSSKKEALASPQISIDAIKGQDYLFARIDTPKTATAKLLQNELPKLILGLEFPKKMRWADLDISYPRPLSWIVCMIGNEPLPFALEYLLAGKTSFGHRQQKPGPFEIPSADAYVETCKKHHVIVDPKARVELIKEHLRGIEEQVSGKIVAEDRVIPQVLYLAEYPMPTVSTFDTTFLKAPKEVLVSEMVDHQKYFPIEDGDGSLQNRFVMTLDTQPNDLIRKGNQKVLSSRLNDGVFLYEKDLSLKEEALREKLKTVTWLEGLGSLFDKTERLKKHAAVLQKALKMSTKEDVVRAAELSKLDLVTNMVFEFPELQGVMGRYYSKNFGAKSAICHAVEEQWLPKGENSPLPESETGIILSLADKIDTLIGCFSKGLIPTSSQDPHALRRQAFGIIKILIEKKSRLNLSAILRECSKHFSNVPESTVVQILDFFLNRVKSVFLNYGVTKDEIEASLSSGVDDIYDAYLKVKALQEFRTSGKDFQNLLEVFKRAKGQINGQVPFVIHKDLLKEPSEKALFSAIVNVQTELEQALKKEEYNRAWTEIAKLHTPLANLFDSVKILSDETELRQNRIALLQGVFSLFETLLDFGKIRE